MKKVYLLFHTVKHLKSVQIFNRIKRRINKIYITKVSGVFLRNKVNDWYRAELIQSSYVGSYSFKFLNHIGSIDSWNNKQQSKLWLYNLHYFDDLNAAGANMRVDFHSFLIEKWIEENPPFDGDGWDPYPKSLRIVNWVKYFLSLGNPSEKAKLSLYKQANVLSQNLEYHLLGNHLFANAKALIFAGIYFSGECADHWFNMGIDILDKEIPEQILSDGGNFELSPMYHNIILADMLDLYNLAITYQIPKFEERLNTWKTIIIKMIKFSQIMSHPDGEVSFFNDSAIGIAPNISSLMLYAGGLAIDFELQLQPDEKILLPSCEYLSDSGYVALTDRNYKAILDVANVGPDYIPGHAHADTLSFELSIFGERVFVNSGTGEYGISDERLRQRKTAAHNTVEIDGQDSSEVWSGFRVARRAYTTKPLISHSNKSLEVKCSHNGYQRLKSKITHNRTWKFMTREINVHDFLDGGSYKTAFAYYHIHPDILVTVSNNQAILTLTCGAIVSLESSEQIDLVDTTWHPEFGLSIPNKKLVIPLIDSRLSISIKF